MKVSTKIKVLRWIMNLIVISLPVLLLLFVIHILPGPATLIYATLLWIAARIAYVRANNYELAQ